MERLAKEKIAAQNRILFLKRELAQYDVDFSKILPEQLDINIVKSERSGENLIKNILQLRKSIYNRLFFYIETESSIKGGMLYNPSTSLSTINASSSPSNASVSYNKTVLY